MVRNQILTTKELAEYLKLNEKTVIKMAQSGELPGVKLGGQWRFHLVSIDAYLQRKIIRSSDEELNTIIKKEVPVILLSRLVDEKNIDLNFEGGSYDEMLRHLAQMAANTQLTPDGKELLRELKMRENMLSTALGSGIAIPHPRNPSEKLFPKPGLIIVYSGRGIDFNAPDGKPVQLFFLICAPDETVHLKMLASIAKLVHKQRILERIAETGKVEEVMKILLEFDRDNMFTEA